MEHLLSKSGELAALSTAVLWAFTATFFTLAGRTLGARTVNFLRLMLAVIFLVTVHMIVYSKPFPDLSMSRSWFFLALSGIIGLALGDSLLFQSFLDIGTQKAMVVMSSWPIFSSLLAWFLLNEQLASVEIYGIIATIIGISIVISSKVESESETRPLRGVLLAAGGALCQAVGILFAKKGLALGMDSLSGTVVRMMFAALSMALFMAFLKSFGKKDDHALSLKGLSLTFFGAITGPFLGVWLSLYAVSHAKVGVASALMTTSPVLLIPLSSLFLNEKVRKSGIIGTIITVVGSYILFSAKPG